jgi:hypothetical protein
MSDPSKTPFTPLDLADALMRRMAEAFADFRLNSANPTPAPGTEYKPVSFYLMAPPPRERSANNAEVGPELPLVVVRPRSLIDEEGARGAAHSAVTVEFVIVTRRLNAEGGLDAWAIVNRIRSALLRSPVIEKGARLERPLESEVGAGDEFPNWAGVVTARFCISQPESNEVEL